MNTEETGTWATAATMRGARSALLFGFALHVAACDERTQQPEAGEVAPSARPTDGANADAENPDAAKSAQKKDNAPKGPSGASANAAQGKCPFGTYDYDFNQFLVHALSANMPDIKVKKKSGKVLCKLSGAEEGELSCSTTGGPVHLEFEANAGITMTVSVKMEGTAVSKFQHKAPGVLHITASDLSKMSTQAGLVMGGKQLDLPAFDWGSAFGTEKSDLLYRCEGDVLFMKPDHESAGEDYYRLTPVR